MGRAPTFPDGRVGDEVVGVHGRFADHDVGGDEERQFFHVLQNFQHGVTRRTGVRRCALVQNQRFDRVRVGVPCAGDDLLVDVARIREERALGGVAVALEEQRLFVGDLLAVEHDAERAELARVRAAVEQIEGRVGFVAQLVPVPAAGGQPAGPVGIADQHVERDHRLAVVVAVGVLHRPAIDVYAGFFAVRGQFARHFDDLPFGDAADFRPFGHAVFAGRFLQQQHRALIGDAVGRAFCEKVAFDGVVGVVGVKGDQFAVTRDDEVMRGVGVFRHFQVDVGGAE